MKARFLTGAGLLMLTVKKQYARFWRSAWQLNSIRNREAWQSQYFHYLVFDMHETALTNEGKLLFPEFAKFSGFYLVGGTGLALQIGHRLSVDFDFFSEKELPPNILQKVKRVFPSASLAVTYQTADQLNILINNIKTTFLYYPYPLIAKCETYQNIQIAAVSEIAAMKAFSLGRRLSYKDYVDWYFMLKERHTTIDGAIALAQKKFGNEFNDRLFVGQLLSIDDVSEQKIDFLRDKANFATIKRFLKITVKDFTSRL